MKQRTLLALAFAVALMTWSTGCVISGGEDSSLTVYNESDYVLVSIQLSPVGASSWGENVLHGDVLYPGEELTVSFIDCDYYDVRVVDETGLACILLDLSLCFDDASWVVDNYTLDTCAYG